MDIMHDIEIANDKFLAIPALRELIVKLDVSQYCVWGNFLSSALFQTSFTGSFDILVKDESDAHDTLSRHYKIDSLHGTIILDESNGGEKGSQFKIRLVDANSKNSDFRNFIIEHSDLRPCAIVSPSGEMDKLELPIPRRGAGLLLNLI